LRDSGYSDPVFMPDDDRVEQNTSRLKLVVNVEALGIFYDYGHAAAPQEWLTGLTFGAIPSWSTRHQMKMTFELFDGGRSVRRWEYMPEMLWINHLILFPVSIYQIATLGSDDEHQAAQLSTATRHFMGGPR